MRRDFYILWVDDEFPKQSYSLIDMVNEVDTYVSNLGFRAVIEKRNNFDDAMDFLNSHPKIDMFICDYNIGEKKGIELFKDIRIKYKQDLILYSNIGKAEIKKEIITYLEQPIAPEFFSRFTFASLNDDGAIETIEKIIQLNIMKWQEINGLRGMVLAEVSQIHHDLVSKINQSTLIRQELTRIYNTNISIDTKLVNGHIKKYIQGEALSEKIEFSIICNMLIPLNNPLFSQYKSIAELRNSLAHVSEEYDSSKGYFLHSLKNSDVYIYEKDITDKRKELLKFEDDLNLYLSTLLS